MHHLQLNPKVSVSIVFVAALFMSIMDTTIVNVALPSIARQLGVSADSLDAIVVGYMVSLAVIIPVSGWLGDRFGTKRIFLFALALFSVASALCGLSINFPMLVGFRVLQGMAGGAMTPVGTTILYRTFPPAERVQVSRVLIVPTVIAPAVGPVLGGLLVDLLSWRWVFFVNVPIGIAACIFSFFFLQEYRDRTAGHFDLAGFLLAGSGLALVMYALSEGPSYGWTSISILGSAVGGLLLLSVFAVVEVRVQEPMLDLHLFGNRLFRSANLVTLFSSAGFLGVLYAAPLYLQVGRGVSALTSGLTTFPEAIGVVVSTQIAAQLYPRIGPRRLMAGGLLGASVVMVLLSLMESDTSLWWMRLLIFLAGVGMGFSFLSAQTATFATISPRATGQASALANALRQIGSALGVAVVGSALGIVGPTLETATGVVVPNLTAYHAAFLAAAVLEAIAVVFAFTIHDRDAAATMQRQVRHVEEAELSELPPRVETGL
ncbi:MAG: MFS transporter [Ktedonobacter sp. 13_2_20CM_2_54_8]|nr:MAG: MFS transporter [Ktedonobacter sp. 13_2_20CM_2_54_8]